MRGPAYAGTMNKRVELIVEEARKLTPAEREELFARLQVEFDDDLADGTPEEIEAAWVEEVERRVARAERGETTFVDHNESMLALRARLAAPGSTTRRPLDAVMRDMRARYLGK